MSSLSRLLVVWEDSLDQGRELSPEQLTAGHPELLGPLREATELLRRSRQQAPTGDTPFGTGASSSGALPPPPRMAAAEQGDAPPGYEVLGELGRGGMGVVYKARQAGLNRVVALKMILSGGHAGLEERARFLAEAEAVARVRHPGIVQVFDFGTHNALPYYSLELCEGGSLADRLREGPLPPREAAVVVEKVARAVQAAHEAGIVHRDLKPHNVLFAHDGSPRVTDFGLAKRTDTAGHTQTGAVLGTPNFMAPEQAEGKKTVGPSADVWALGSVLYACLTGRPPFQAASALDTLLQVVADDHVPVRRLNPKVPADLETICHKCLAKEPGRRYDSARDMAEDLSRWLEGRPIEARPVGQIERLWSWCRREPVTASLIGAVALALLAGTAVAWGLAGWALGEKGRADTKASEASQNEELARKREQDANTQKGRADAKAKEALEAEGRAKRQLAQTELVLYAGQLSRAQREWQADNARQALDFLNGCHWGLRGWEHHFLWTLFHSNQHTLRHAGEARAVAFSPDGNLIVSGGGTRDAPGEVLVWDARRGKVALSLRGHTRLVTTVACSPDNTLIASGAEDRTARLWGAQSGQPLHVLRGHSGYVYAVAFSPDGKRVVTAAGGLVPSPGGKNPFVATGELFVWDVETGRRLLSLVGHGGEVLCAAFSPDGKQIVSGGGRDYFDIDRPGELKLWDAHTGKELRSLTGHRVFVTCVAFSPDGRRIVSGSWGRHLRAWDVTTGAQAFSVEAHAQGLNSIAFSPDGRRILTASSDGTLKVSDAQTGTGLVTLKGHTAEAQAAAFSPDGGRIASASKDGTVKVWEAEKAQQGRAFRGHTGEVVSLAFSPDGRLLASGGWDNRVKVWDVQSGREVVALAGHTRWVTGVAFSPDGKHVASASWDKTVKVWGATTGRLVLTLAGHAGYVNCLAYRPDGKRIVSASGVSDKQGDVLVWDTEKGQKLLALAGHAARVNCVAYSPDGARIVTGSDDRALKVWDAQTGAALLTLRGHTGNVRDVAFSRDGQRIASNGYDGALKVWDARTGQEALKLRATTGHGPGVAFSPDGKRIISGGDNGTLKVWDAEMGQELVALPAHKDGLRCVAFSPDGKRIASGGPDRMVRVWEALTSQQVYYLTPYSDTVKSVEFSADGKRIRSLTDKGNRLDFDAGTGQPLPPDRAAMPPAQAEARQPNGGLVARIDGYRVRVALPGAADGTNPRLLGQSQAIWHEEQARACEKARQWPAAAFHLERLYRARPGLGHRERLAEAVWLAEDTPLVGAIRRSMATTDAARVASAAGQGGPWSALAQLPGPPAGALQLGQLAAEAGNWPRAVEAFRAAARRPGSSPWTALDLLLALRAAGREAEAREAAWLLARHALAEKDADRRSGLLFYLLNTPCDARTARALCKLTAAELAAKRTPLALHSHGVALWRAGKYEEAEKVLNESVKAHGKGGYVDTALYLALALRKRGKNAEAEKELAWLRDWHAKQSFTWQKRVMWEQLIREASGPPRMAPAE